MSEYTYNRCYVCENNGDLTWTEIWRPRTRHRVFGTLKPGLEAWEDSVSGTWAVLCRQHLVELRAKTALDALKEGRMDQC